MWDNKDLVEVNLNASNSTVGAQKSSFSNNMSLFRFKESGRGSAIPYKQSLPANAESAPKNAELKAMRSIFGGSIEFVSNSYQSPTDLSCLRQMYCPDCEQRLHVDNISYDRLLHCCLPVFPFKCLFKRVIERRQSGNKVMCKKCGGNLGYWKQK
ncbi:uncharacterized protein LOC129243559 [Anastrepha obliqua]|uniref:uncharacterized protein LOC129243559 n=1 Tax=Anastrepha obliqua TaxID=95512 RepID=UPI00240A0A06|nr:uncharacterized protein LOC129243559 [Anastrepha obliqua]